MACEKDTVIRRQAMPDYIVTIAIMGWLVAGMVATAYYEKNKGE